MANEEKAASSEHRVAQVVVGIAIAVMTSIAITVLTPLGTVLQDIMFPTRATVVGVVQLEGSNAPVAGAQITAGGATVNTGPGGTFSLKEMKRGEHVLEVRHATSITTATNFIVSRGEDNIDLGALVVQPAYALKHQVRNFNAAFWIDGDEQALSAVRRVSYTFPDGSGIQPVTSDGDGRTCVVIFDYFDPTSGFEGVSARVELADGQQAELANASAASSRPDACEADQPQIPEVIGRGEREARQLLRGAGFTAIQVTTLDVHCPDQVALVVAARPAPGWPWPQERTVALHVGKLSQAALEVLDSPRDRFFCSG